jgi:hypothetical protein
MSFKEFLIIKDFLFLPLANLYREEKKTPLKGRKKKFNFFFKPGEIFPEITRLIRMYCLTSASDKIDVLSLSTNKILSFNVWIIVRYIALQQKSTFTIPVSRRSPRNNYNKSEVYILRNIRD